MCAGLHPAYMWLDIGAMVPRAPNSMCHMHFSANEVPFASGYSEPNYEVFFISMVCSNWSEPQVCFSVFSTSSTFLLPAMEPGIFGMKSTSPTMQLWPPHNSATDAATGEASLEGVGCGGWEHIPHFRLNSLLTCVYKYIHTPPECTSVTLIMPPILNEHILIIYSRWFKLQRPLWQFEMIAFGTRQVVISHKCILMTDCTKETRTLLILL